MGSLRPRLSLAAWILPIFGLPIFSQKTPVRAGMVPAARILPIFNLPIFSRSRPIFGLSIFSRSIFGLMIFSQKTPVRAGMVPAALAFAALVGSAGAALLELSHGALYT